MNALIFDRFAATGLLMTSTIILAVGLAFFWVFWLPCVSTHGKIM